MVCFLKRRIDEITIKETVLDQKVKKQEYLLKRAGIDSMTREEAKSFGLPDEAELQVREGAGGWGEGVKWVKCRRGTGLGTEKGTGTGTEKGAGSTERRRNGRDLKGQKEEDSV